MNIDLKQLSNDIIPFKGRLHQELDTLFEVVDLLSREIQLKDQLITRLLGEIPEKYHCPVCDSNLKYFLPLPNEYKDNAKKYGFKHFGRGEMTSIETYSCPNCGASDRERLYAYWLCKEFNNSLQLDSKIIHFAPEAGLSKWLRKQGFTDYKTADLMMSNVDYQVDITHLPFFVDDQFDFFICSHVLEHVWNDDLAISELYRITKRGGMGILMAPINIDLENTIEDTNISDPGERYRLFGQQDHVRLYAHNDYVSKIKKHGFAIRELDINYFGAEVFYSLGLKPTSILYIVRK